MNTLVKSLLILVSVIAIGSCKRREEPVAKPGDVGGKGGSAVLKITPKHHSKVIYSATVYIKYNAEDKPSSFDDSARCTKVNGTSIAEFSGLKKGKYYLFGKGYDSTISNSVVGGVPYTISEEKGYDVSLSVTEGD